MKKLNIMNQCLILLLIFASALNAALTNDFRAFIHNRYGVEMVSLLEREDLGQDASFGGRLDGQVSDKEPVIIVHGITNKITRFQVC